MAGVRCKDCAALPRLPVSVLEVLAQALDRLQLRHGFGQLGLRLGQVHGFAAVGQDSLGFFLGVAHRRLGDPRACHLDGWRSLFPDFEISFTRHQLDLSGDFPTLWRTLSTTYDAALLPRAALDDLAATFATWCADRFAPSAIPLHMVLWLAVATRA